MSSKRNDRARRKVASRNGSGSSLVAFQRFLRENKNLTPSFDSRRTCLTVEEVSKHSSPSDCWTIYNGNVYNIGPFLKHHPGGAAELLRGAGNDCTELYNKYHSWVNADAVLGHLKLGPLQTHINKKTTSIPDAPADFIREGVRLPELIAPLGDSAVESPRSRKVLEDETRIPFYRVTMQTLGHNIGIFKAFNSASMRGRF